MLKLSLHYVRQTANAGVRAHTHTHTHTRMQTHTHTHTYCGLYHYMLHINDFTELSTDPVTNSDSHTP